MNYVTAADLYVEAGGLRIARALHDFVNAEAIPGTGIEPRAFWQGFGMLVRELAPRNHALLDRRDALQQQIDGWHRSHPGGQPGALPIDQAAYLSFLHEIGYLQPEPREVAIDTSRVDAEIASIAGPQLVVPVTNARYALNAANARWGSLYDALYGTDAIPEDGGATRGSGYNPVRGDRVIARARAVLDQVAPLAAGSHADATRYVLDRTARDGAALAVTLGNGSKTGLRDPAAFVGYRGDGAGLSAVLLRHHGLHVEIQIDRSRPIGRDDPAGVADVLLEAAITTIQDLEDSIAAVDAEDKVLAYRNWLGLMVGTLEDTFEKGGLMMTRRLHTDRRYQKPGGGTLTLSGRSLMLVRNVGHHMYTDAVLDADGRETPEGLLDAAVTSLIALHDLNNSGPLRNSRDGLGLHRQAEDARPGRSGLHRHAVHPRGGSAEPAALHAENGHHGRGAAHLRQPEGLHRRGETPRGVHQHRLPRSHRRRDPYLDGSRADDAQERHEGHRLDQGLRGPERRYRPAMRPARQRADRQGHVGRARPDGRYAGAEGRAPAGGGQHRLGAVPHRRHAARAALPRGGRRRPADRTGVASAGTAGRPADDPRRSPCGDPSRNPWPTAPPGRRRRCSRSWTTTARASWATWCAGSTRASGAPRCRTSTMSG